jgi:hypothetical protein
MIQNASNVTLNNTQPNLPNMSTTLEGWFQNLVVGILTKTIVNFRTVETTQDFETKGVLQPFSERQLEILPEGQRAWMNYMLHCQPSLSLKPDDTVTIKGNRYRNMGIMGYDDYGYIQYRLVKDYETAITLTP